MDFICRVIGRTLESTLVPSRRLKEEFDDLDAEEEEDGSKDEAYLPLLKASVM